MYHSKLIKLLFALLLILNVTGNARAGNILVLGDSLSAAYGIDVEAGWVNLLQRRLTQMGTDWTVINASISGDTSSGGLNRLEPLLIRYQPELLLLELGANDGLRGLSLTRLEENLDAIIERAQTANSQVLLIGVELPRNYGKRFNQKFSAIFSRLAQKHKKRLVTSLLGDVALKPELMQQDGLHPTVAAQPLLLENVWEKLQNQLN